MGVKVKPRQLWHVIITISYCSGLNWGFSFLSSLTTTFLCQFIPPCPSSPNNLPSVSKACHLSLKFYGFIIPALHFVASFHNWDLGIIKSSEMEAVKVSYKGWDVVENSPETELPFGCCIIKSSQVKLVFSAQSKITHLSQKSFTIFTTRPRTTVTFWVEPFTWKPCFVFLQELIFS